MGMVDQRPLYRSKNRILFGICGAIADYLGVDATVVRVITVILTIMGCGIPILLYLVALIFVPDAPTGTGPNPYIDVNPARESARTNGSGRRIVRLLLLIILAAAVAFGILGFVVGLVLGAWQFDLAIFGGVATVLSVIWFILTTVLPLLIVIAALIFLVVVTLRGSAKREGSQKLVRSSRNKKIGGVCGGIASYLKADPLVVRVVTLIAAVFCWYVIVPIYILFWIILPIDTKTYGNWV